MEKIKVSFYFYKTRDTVVLLPAATLAALTVRNGGNVLVPCYPSGVIYDLLECLFQYIDSAGLSSLPFYFISPVANSSLEFSQIFAEWYVRVLRSEFPLRHYIQAVRTEMTLFCAPVAMGLSLSSD